MTLFDQVFAGAHFDRLGYRRCDHKWITAQIRSDSTCWVPVWNTLNLLSHDTQPDAVLVQGSALPPAAAEHSILLGEFNGKVCFAVDLGEEPRVQSPLSVHGQFRGLRTVGLLLPGDRAALLAYAQAMVLWHRRQQYCGRCGSVTDSDEAGHVRRCTNTDCAQSIFPRIDPAIIVLVERNGRALLGRQPGWPEGLYSTIAGFVEPGESLEDAVRREVAEETGVQVGPVRYRSSQPWPFPSSLMLGYQAGALSDDIERHDGELEDARWLSRAELIEGLRNGSLRVPQALSISNRLIAEWFDAGKPGQLAEIVADCEARRSDAGT